MNGHSSCGKSDVWMDGRMIDGWIDSVSSRYSFVVSQMDGWMESVSLR